MRKLIGVSLSLCIADIIRGNVSENEVDTIIAATCVKNDEDLQTVITGYRQGYWSANPDLGEEITRRLFAKGKIQQPRLDGNQHPGSANGCWQNLTDEFCAKCSQQLTSIELLNTDHYNDSFCDCCWVEPEDVD